MTTRTAIGGLYEKGGFQTSALQVELREGESAESLLSRFTKMIQREGILKEAKSRRHFVSNRELARIAQRKAARKRRRSNTR